MPTPPRDLTPPVAPARPATRTLWGDDVVDPHPWLREADNPEVIAHLEAENEFTEAMLSGTEALQETLFAEIKSRVKETDLSVPVEKDGWSYYGRTVEGLPYPIHCRRSLAGEGDASGGEEGPEQILLDENVEADAVEGDYFELGVFDVSPDHSLLIWGADRAGDERFDVTVRTLLGDVSFEDRLVGVTYGSAWAMDNRSFFYLRVDDANRPYQVWHHVLDTDPDDDRLVYQEDDERFFCSVGRDKDDRFIMIGVSSAITDEVWYLPADDPMVEPVCFLPRRNGIEYSISHFGSRFLVLTNDGSDDGEGDERATNFRLMTCPDDAVERANWTELIAERADVMLTGFDIFQSHLVIFERAEGLTRISAGPWTEIEDEGAAACQVLEQSESVYSVWPGANPSIESSRLRFGYSSMVTPSSVFTHDLATDERVLLKQQEVLGAFDPAEYETWREWAVADDGTRVPISVVRRRDRPDPGPVLLYAYGAYEASMDPTFSTIRLSLLDRGFAFALAHPRGGGEMGRRWYEDGKFEQKMNTFTDMVACARHLIDAGLTEPGRLVLRGGSAGGLMAGATVNLAPELFGAVVAEVPFVDVITTMLDPTLPLTVTEWEEWGNPETESIYRAMRAYAPLENVTAAPYPAMYITAGLSDPRVGFWEPAKWVQALRANTTSGRPVLLRTEMSAGHFGPSGRYAAWRDEARTLAFVLWALGLDQVIADGLDDGATTRP